MLDRRDGGCIRTTTGSVVTGLLAEEGLVLHCMDSPISFLLRLGKSVHRALFAALASFGIGRENVRLARKNSPEMLRASQRTTTIFWPFRSCLATVLARRPSKCPLPSMTICSCPHCQPSDPLTAIFFCLCLRYFSSSYLFNCSIFHSSLQRGDSTYDWLKFRHPAD